MLNKIFHITLKEKDTAIYSFPCPSVKRKYIVYITYIHTHSTQCVQLTQVLLDMLLSWKKNGRQHKANITSPKQSRYAVKKARVLKCSVVAHLVVLLIPSYTREDVEQSKDRNEDNSTGIFHPDFYDGGRGVTPLQVSVKFREGRPLGVTGSKGKTRATVLGRGQVSTHLTPHASQHVPTVRCKPWEKAGFVWDTGSAESSPLLSKQLLLFIVLSKEAFCCLIKCSPLVSSL